MVPLLNWNLSWILVLARTVANTLLTGRKHSLGWREENGTDQEMYTQCIISWAILISGHTISHKLMELLGSPPPPTQHVLQSHPNQMWAHRTRKYLLRKLQTKQPLTRSQWSSGDLKAWSCAGNPCCKSLVAFPATQWGCFQAGSWPWGLDGISKSGLQKRGTDSCFKWTMLRWTSDFQ